jgi:hypothetical protein
MAKIRDLAISTLAFGRQANERPDGFIGGEPSPPETPPPCQPSSKPKPECQPSPRPKWAKNDEPGLPLHAVAQLRQQLRQQIGSPPRS